MRECGAQGGKGVWNSWPSGGASCSLALQPLASWDKTGMSGWEGGGGKRVCVHDVEDEGVRECFCHVSVRDMTQGSPGCPPQAKLGWTGWVGTAGQTMWQGYWWEESRSVTYAQLRNFIDEC